MYYNWFEVCKVFNFLYIPHGYFLRRNITKITIYNTQTLPKTTLNKPRQPILAQTGHHDGDFEFRIRPVDLVVDWLSRSVTVRHQQVRAKTWTGYLA